jgi:hypothetical protein
MSLDPNVLIAQAGSVLGNAVATFVLQKDGKGAIIPLQNLASALPNIALGKVTPYTMGALTAQLQVLNGQATSGNNAAVVAQLASLLDLVAQAEANAAGTGDITGIQALLSGAATNIANGIMNAVNFYSGQLSITNPPASP